MTSPEEKPELDFIRPALAGGAFLGVLSNLPFIGAANIFCCVWMWTGGALAARLLARQRPGKISSGDGAFVGVMAGFVDAVVGTILSIPVRLAAAQMLGPQTEAIDRLTQMFPDVDESVRRMMERMLSYEVSPLTILVGFFSNLLIYALFAMIGGIVMTVLLRRKVPKPE